MYHKVSSWAGIRADASAYPNARANAIRPSIVTLTPTPESTRSFSARAVSASTASAISAAEGLAPCVCVTLLSKPATNRHPIANALVALPSKLIRNTFRASRRSDGKRSRAMEHSSTDKTHSARRMATAVVREFRPGADRALEAQAAVRHWPPCPDPKVATTNRDCRQSRHHQVQHASVPVFG